MAKGKDPSETNKEFKSVVNMSVKELEKWLKTREKQRGGVSTTHTAMPLALIANCRWKFGVTPACQALSMYHHRLAGPLMVANEQAMSQGASLWSFSRRTKTSTTKTTSSTWARSFRM